MRSAVSQKLIEIRRKSLHIRAKSIRLQARLVRKTAERLLPQFLKDWDQMQKEILSALEKGDVAGADEVSRGWETVLTRYATQHGRQVARLLERMRDAQR